MSFDDIKAAVLALPEVQQFEIVDAVEQIFFEREPMAAEQRLELAARERASFAGTDGAEDGDVVMARLFTDDDELTPAQRADLRSRVAESDADRDEGQAWDEVRPELLEALEDVQRHRAATRKTRTA